MGCAQSQKQQWQFEDRTLPKEIAAVDSRKNPLNNLQQSKSCNQNTLSKANKKVKSKDDYAIPQNVIQSKLFIIQDISSEPSQISSFDKQQYLYNSNTGSKPQDNLVVQIFDKNFQSASPSKTYNTAQSTIIINKNSLTAPQKTQD